ncbi:hypothetical protein [Streptomyces sp. NPDC051662]|uniref:hypothetical protein n=1 Tax=Streptomyces sp. NPDC051662 TaxID=3154750 RepID=UPI003416C8E3
MTISFSDVVRYTADNAALDDLDLFSEAAKEGRARVAKERMDALVAGQEIRVDRLQDKELNGITGTIHSVNRSLPKQPVAVLLVDSESLWMLQGHHKYAHRIPKGATTYTLTMPLACVFPR